METPTKCSKSFKLSVKSLETITENTCGNFNDAKLKTEVKIETKK